MRDISDVCSKKIAQKLTDDYTFEKKIPHLFERVELNKQNAKKQILIDKIQLLIADLKSKKYDVSLLEKELKECQH